MPVPAGFVIVVVPATVRPPPFAWRNAGLPAPVPLLSDKVPNVRVPAELFCRQTPLVPPLILVLPKLRFAVDAVTRMPWEDGFVMEVPPVTIIFPATLVRIIPCPPLLEVEVTPVKVAANA